MRSRKEAYTTAILEDDNISETATGGNAGYQRTTPPPQQLKRPPDAYAYAYSM